MSETTATQRIAAVVLAAGRGARMAARRNKAFLEIGGRPLLEWTVRALAAAAAIDEWVLVTRPDEPAEAEQALALARRALGGAGRAAPVLRVAAGGAERVDSVQSGVRALSRTVELVLIHDAARPFVSVRLVADLLTAARTCGGAIPALPVADTLKRVALERIASTVDRTGLFAAQTPQAFRAEPLRRALAHQAASATPVTDDAALFELAGLPVAVVPGDPANFKITTPADLELARLHATRRPPPGDTS